MAKRKLGKLYKCEECGKEVGQPGKRHKKDCPKRKKATPKPETPSPSEFRVDERTSLGKLIKMEAEIADELAERMKTNKAEVVAMRKSYESLSKLEDEATASAERLAKAKADFGL
jgi:hypothetical protein